MHVFSYMDLQPVVSTRLLQVVGKKKPQRLLQLLLMLSDRRLRNQGRNNDLCPLPVPLAEILDQTTFQVIGTERRKDLTSSFITALTWNSQYLYKRGL